MTAEISDYEKNKKLCNSLKFGDVIINHWASDDNPRKIGVFVKKCSYSGNPSIEATDMKGSFWYFHIDKGMKIEFAGSNIFSQSANEEIEKLKQDIGTWIIREAVLLKEIDQLKEENEALTKLISDMQKENSTSFKF